MPNDAISLYEDALAIDNQNPYILNNIGWIIETCLADLHGAMKKYSLAMDRLKPETGTQKEMNL